MIKVCFIMNLLRNQLSNWNISRNDDALYAYINMGMIDLYEKFNLGIRSESIRVVPEQMVYNLKNDDVNLILKCYSEDGRELRSSDVVDSKDWEYKIINYKTLMINNVNKVDGIIYVLYKSAPIPIVDTDDYLDLPDAFKEVLMLYGMYLGTATIHSEASNEYRSWDTKSVFYTLYTSKCAELQQLGYKIPIDSEGMGIVAKGYV